MILKKSKYLFGGSDKCSVCLRAELLESGRKWKRSRVVSLAYLALASLALLKVIAIYRPL